MGLPSQVKVWTGEVVLAPTITHVVIGNVRHAREAILSDAVVASCRVFPRLAPVLAKPPGKDLWRGPRNWIDGAVVVRLNHCVSCHPEGCSQPS